MKLKPIYKLIPIAIFIILFAALRSSAIDHVPEHPHELKPIEGPPTTDWTVEKIKQNPNVIVVLSEAFWDPTLIKGLTFSRDPIPTFHALQKLYPGGWMLSPQFGGGTANVEFEVLTGNSMRFLPEGSIPYESEIQTDIESLASIFSRQGYTSTAISPFHNWYFDSRNAYKNLGFSRFISLEYFNPNEYVGPYIGDAAVAKRIIEESERNAGPDFIFANTMENHYHYWSGKFEKNTISVKGEDIDGETSDLLETLAQGLHGADQMLSSLILHYRMSKEPTIIVFFGDHLPFLEEDYHAYKDSKYITGTDDPEFWEKTHNVPFLVWNNFSVPTGEKLHFSPSFLGPYILKAANVKGTEYTDFLAALSKRNPIVPPVGREAEFNVNSEVFSEYEARMKEKMEGKGAEDLKGHPFVLGYGDPNITEVTSGADSTLLIKGQRFGLGSKVLIDGKQMDTTWMSEHALSAKLPRSVNKSKPMEVKVQVIDEKKTVLAQSNSISFSY